MMVPSGEMRLACLPAAMQLASSSRGEPSEVRAPWKILMAMVDCEAVGLRGVDGVVGAGVLGRVVFGVGLREDDREGGSEDVLNAEGEGRVQRP